MQTVETLIRRRVLRRLIWDCTVCQCPFYETLGVNGLKLRKERERRTEFGESSILQITKIFNNYKYFNMTDMDIIILNTRI